MARQLSDLRLAVMILDGRELKRRMMTVALGITTDGAKTRLGLWAARAENATIATAQLERRRDPEHETLFVLDGPKPLRGGLRSPSGEVSVFTM